MEKIGLFIRKICAFFDLIAAVILFLSCVLVVLNIITRSLFRHPIFGVYEIVCYTFLISVSLALANCYFEGGHINLTLIQEKLSPKIKGIIEIVLGVIIFGNFAVIAWNIGLYTIERVTVGDVSPVMRIPIVFLMSIILIGFTLLTISVLIKIIDEIRGLAKLYADKS